MNTRHNTAKASTMQRLYQVKILRAERLVSAQAEVVAHSQQSYLESVATVESLKLKLLENSDFRKQPTVCNDALRLVETLRHREQIEYTLERQSFYLQQAEDDLNFERAELTSRKQALEKIRAKQEAANKIARKITCHAAMQRQDRLEEETPQTTYAGAR